MKPTKPLLFLIILAVAAAAAPAEEPRVNTLDGGTLTASALTAEILEIMRREEIPGLSIAVINDNEIAYHAALGVGNAETGETVDDQSVFEGASLSKPIFAYFALKLVEEGVLDLDRSLHEYLPHPGIAPASREASKAITARMVLAHQTGFPNHSFGEPITLAFQPGTGFGYSGEAYQYLAAVIASLTGTDLGAELNNLFRETVTRPLLMTHTTFIWDDYLQAHKVYGHDEEGNPTQKSPAEGGWNGETFNAFSSLHSEASEYARFIVAMLKREGLEEDTFDAMLREETRFAADNPLQVEVGQTGWGLGFAQKRTPRWTMHLHTGNNHDFQSYAMFVPEESYGLVVFTNSGRMVPLLEGLSELLGPQF